MLNILVTNDDGVNAKVLYDIQSELKEIANVVIVAPSVERSASGHTVTLHDPLRLNEVDNNVYSCSGFPADCVILGINEVFDGKIPDLVISGINRGGNMGQDIYYSGTVAAAREGLVCKIPSIAISLAMDFEKFISHDNDQALNYDLGVKLLGHLVKNGISNLIKKGEFLNINYPNISKSEIKGVKSTVPGFIEYSKKLESREDSRGKKYFWIGTKNMSPNILEIDGSDCYLVKKGYISVTSMSLKNLGIEVDQSLIKLIEDFI